MPQNNRIALYMFNIKQHFMTMFINGNEETATKSKTFFLIANIHISLQLQKNVF